MDDGFLIICLTYYWLQHFTVGFFTFTSFESIIKIKVCLSVWTPSIKLTILNNCTALTYSSSKFQYFYSHSNSEDKVMVFYAIKNICHHDNSQFIFCLADIQSPETASF